MIGFIASTVNIINWVAGVAIILCMTVLPMFALFKKTRIIAGIGYYISSYFLGLATFIQCLLITYAFWGWIGIILGLLLAGVGIIPFGLIASAIHGEWFIAGSILVNLIFVVGTKKIGLWLVEKVDNQNKMIETTSRDVEL